MDNLLKQAEQLLTTDVNQNYQAYLEFYQLAFGRQYSGCRCKSNKIKQQINEWYIQNKNE